MASEENISSNMAKLCIKSDATDDSPRRSQCKRKADVMQTSDSGSGSDRDTNTTDESTDDSLEKLKGPQFKEKQFKFLKKYYDRLRTYKPMCNWYERYGFSTTSKPPRLEDFPCECNHENKSTKKGKQTQAKNLYTYEDLNPLAGHDKSCNVNRLNLYFLEISSYFCSDTLDKRVFLKGYSSFSVDFKKKEQRLKRKAGILLMRDGLDECLDDCLEDLSESMNDKEIEEGTNRNKVREFLNSILSNMLDSVIDSSSSESSDDERDDAPMDEEKVKYKKLKAEYQDYRDYIEGKLKFRHLKRQKVILASHLKEMKERRDENRYSYLTEESESESEINWGPVPETDSEE